MQIICFIYSITKIYNSNIIFIIMDDNLKSDEIWFSYLAPQHMCYGNQQSRCCNTAITSHVKGWAPQEYSPSPIETYSMYALNNYHLKIITKPAKYFA